MSAMMVNGAMQLRRLVGLLEPFEVRYSHGPTIENEPTSVFFSPRNRTHVTIHTSDMDEIVGPEVVSYVFARLDIPVPPGVLD